MYFFLVASMSDDVIVDAPPPLTLNTGQKRARQPIDTYNLEDVEDEEEENLQKKRQLQTHSKSVLQSTQCT